VTPEEQRLEESRARQNNWKRWGPYLSERAWGTVREDYSADGAAWEYFPHDHARSRAYRWNEDGIAGICDRHQSICFAVAMWNEHDPILKERLFGLTGNEGNHGEDVKESYFYLDSTPTHSYMKFLYKYPQREFPYTELVDENRRRTRDDPEYELANTGIFAENRYFDVFVEYAKASPNDILIRITVFNRADVEAPIHLLPTIWFRNTWSWGRQPSRPKLQRVDGSSAIAIEHAERGRYTLRFDGAPELLFTENETNRQRIFGLDNVSPFVKDGINDHVVNSATNAVNQAQHGTKAAGRYRVVVPAGESTVVRLRLTEGVGADSNDIGTDFDSIVRARQREADEFYANVIPDALSSDAANVMRQALGGMLWSKQFYFYVVRDWLNGDPGQPVPPASRRRGRNAAWLHLYNSDVISMPDKWEYPWYASWDLAFHCVALALVDSEFAKDQLILLLREWYMHPNGELPAYEWALGDANPPVHAWAAWRVYKIEKRRRGVGDRQFLQRVFHKLLINFTWWVNRKDAEGLNVFQGGFLGLDNIGVFDRNATLPTGGHLEQSDGTSWMGMYALNMLAIAMELAEEDSAYEDVASKFWEHFLYIAAAMNNLGQEGVSLWDEADGFYYDVIHHENGDQVPLKVRSMVGLIPLFAVETLEPDVLDKLPGFKKRLEWFIDNRPDLTMHTACMRTPGNEARRLLSIVNLDRLRRVLTVMLDENEFFSPFGVRALSRAHRDTPFTLEIGGQVHKVGYEPGESTTGLFGGNSNWRGPVWFPPNFLLIESLQRFHYYLGDDFKVQCPTGSGQLMNLSEVASELSRRLARPFLRDGTGRRAVHGDDARFRDDPNWRDLVLFYEYFHGDNGRGVGASHQTGWTGLVAKLLQQSGERVEKTRAEEQDLEVGIV
jgi:hypothetical protein